MKVKMNDRLDWKDGAVLLVARPKKAVEDALNDEIKKRGLTDLEANFARLESYIVGWEGIEDGDKKPLAFSEDSRRVIAREAAKDEPLLDKMIAFLKGASGN